MKIKIMVYKTGEVDLEEVERRVISKVLSALSFTGVIRNYHKTREITVDILQNCTEEKIEVFLQWK